MKEQIKSHEAKMQKTLDVLSKELAAVRAGRAAQTRRFSIRSPLSITVHRPR